MKSILSKEAEFARLSLCFVFIDITEQLTAFITLTYAGHISQAHLEGVGLAHTLFNLIVVPLTAGHASVFDTFGPQVLGSEGELGTIFLKCLIQGWVLILFVLGPYLNIVYIIDLLPDSGITPKTTLDMASSTYLAVSDGTFKDIAVKYLRITAVVEFLDYLFVLTLKYIAIQDHTKIVYFLSFLMVVSHVLVNYVLVTVLKLGLDGLVQAVLLSRLLPLFAALIICVYMIKQGKFAWNGFNTRILVSWKPMMKLGLAGALNVFAEMSMYEVATFCSQFDGNTAFSVVIIIHQLITMWWSVALGMSRAGATLIGTALGKEDPDQTKLCVKLTVYNSVVVSCILALVSYATMEYQVQLFSSEPGVTNLFTATFWIICIGIPIDHIQTSLNQGILVAFGAQDFTAWSMSISCYVIGLPIILFTIFFANLPVTGVTIGIVAAGLGMLISAIFKIRTVNFDREVANSQERTATEKGGAGTTDEVMETGMEMSNGHENPAYYGPNAESKNSDKSSSSEGLEEAEIERGLLSASQKKEISQNIAAFACAAVIFVIFASVSMI